METVNLKSPITFRVALHGTTTAFTTKTFRGERLQTRTIPDPQERVPYTVHEIIIDSTTIPWFALHPTVSLTILWSNVLAVQSEEAR